MSADSNSRRGKLEAFVAAHPDDAFGRYGLAMECAREGDGEAAGEHFRRLLGTHPDYVAGYFQYGLLLGKLGRNEEARRMLEAGVEAARRRGDAHAAGEMEAAIEALG